MCTGYNAGPRCARDSREQMMRLGADGCVMDSYSSRGVRLLLSASLFDYLSDSLSDSLPDSLSDSLLDSSLSGFSVAAKTPLPSSPPVRRRLRTMPVTWQRLVVSKKRATIRLWAFIPRPSFCSLCQMPALTYCAAGSAGHRDKTGTCAKDR